MAHSLITFKSHQDSLDSWAMKELIGHYINYRKQQCKRGEPLVAEELFRLYAVCARFPHNLAQAVPLTQVQDGV